MRPLPGLLTLVLALAPVGAAVAGSSLTVFAASSLTDAMIDAGDNFQQSQNITVKFSFAASSTLARQIAAGAPAGLVALASEEWADYLAERGEILSRTRVSPVGNRLVLIALPDSLTDAAPPISEPPAAAEITAALGPAGRLALADPAHVPAGIYARQSLENLGLWPAAAARLALTGNVRAALALVARGETPLGVVYATDARIAAQVRTLATLPAASHAPITYPFAIVTGGDSAAARAFLAFLTGPEGLAIFRRHGFTGG